MVKRKICKNGFLLGYWKGKPVAAMPKYHPDAKPEEYIIEEVEFPHDCLVPELIDPKTTSLSVIKEICEFNDFPFLWVTGINVGIEAGIKVTKSDSLEKAIEYFIVFCSAGTTSIQYRRIFDDLIRARVILPHLTVDFYMQRVPETETLSRTFSNKKAYNDKLYSTCIMSRLNAFPCKLVGNAIWNPLDKNMIPLIKSLSSVIKSLIGNLGKRL